MQTDDTSHMQVFKLQKLLHKIGWVAYNPDLTYFDFCLVTPVKSTLCVTTLNLVM